MGNGGRMTPEGKVKAKVKQVLKEVGAYYVMPATGGYGSSGAPDFLICKGGKFYGIECKANGNKPTALQLSHLTKIREAGGVALVIDETNVETLRKELSHED
jgi:Holliday junction resolvase